MIPGKGEYYACPKCNTFHIKGTLISGNTFGAKFYSDARVEYPYLPNFPNITRCNNCNEIFRLTDEITHVSHSQAECYSASFLDVNGYKEALLMVLYDNLEEELELRYELLWTWHRLIADQEMTAQEVYSDFYYVKNIDEIIPTVTNKELGGILLIAELHRFAGRFEEAAQLLQPFRDETEFGMAQESLQRCLNQDRSVYLIQR